MFPTCSSRGGNKKLHKNMAPIYKWDDNIKIAVKETGF